MKTELMMLVGTARRAVRNLALVAAVAVAFGACAATENGGGFVRFVGKVAEGTLK